MSDRRERKVRRKKRKREHKGDMDENEEGCSVKDLKRSLARLKQGRIRSFNDQLSMCARRKKLSDALILFRTLKKQNCCNAHTYVIMINVFVQCGEVWRAENILSDMIKLGLNPGTVGYTSLLKGYCNPERVQNDPQLRKPMELVRSMLASSPAVIPNIRTCNTLLRGCVWVGSTEVAENIIVRMREDWKVKPDESSWEYVVSLQCQSLQAKEAMKIATSVSRALKSHSSAGLSMWLNVAQAAILLGMKKLCRRALEKARLGLSAASADQGADDERKKRTTTNGGVATTHAKGGKRGWNSSDVTRSQSATIFAAHRIERLNHRSRRIANFAERCESDPNALLVRDPWQLARVVSFWGRFATISPASAGKDSNASLAKGFVKSLVKRFGLKRLIAARKKEGGISSSSDTGSSTALSVRSIRKRFERCLVRSSTDREDSMSRRVDFSALLEKSRDGGSGASGASTSKRRPLKMEIACGSGEWIAAQAREESERVDWVALELRHSRVYEVFTRMVYDKLRNLCVVGGDARRILDQHVIPKSVRHIFINHPEPPKQTGSASAREVVSSTEGRHLLDTTFFDAMCEALEEGGMLTIVTDNEWYGNVLVQVVTSAASRARFESPKIANHGAAKIRLHSETDGIRLWVGSPGRACGHATSASSYFDRLWKTGVSRHAASSERYVLFLRKSS
eukprot:g2477.t1